MTVTYRLYETNRRIEARVEHFLLRATLAAVTGWHLFRERTHA